MFLSRVNERNKENTMKIKKMDKYHRDRIRDQKKTLAQLDKAFVAVNSVTHLFENFRSSRVNVVKTARDMIAGKHRSLAIELAGK
jgi:hypothetical protein